MVMVRTYSPDRSDGSTVHHCSAPFSARQRRSLPKRTTSRKDHTVPTAIDPTSLAFLLAENRNQPMHVAGLQLFEKPADAGPHFARDLYESALAADDVAPLFRKHPVRSLGTLGQWAWSEDDQFDIEYHVRHSALP